MTGYQEIVCPECGSNQITKSGRTEQGTQRYRCQNEACLTKTFLLDYRYKTYMPGVKRQVVEDAATHQVGKRNTQKIERKNLNLRTWIKRLTRKTICFSKSTLMHDTVIGLLINKVEFGVDIYAKLQV